MRPPVALSDPLSLNPATDQQIPAPSPTLPVSTTPSSNASLAVSSLSQPESSSGTKRGRFTVVTAPLPASSSDHLPSAPLPNGPLDSQLSHLPSSIAPPSSRPPPSPAVPSSLTAGPRAAVEEKRDKGGEVLLTAQSGSQSQSNASQSSTGIAASSKKSRFTVKSLFSLHYFIPGSLGREGEGDGHFPSFKSFCAR
jgi:hypothetical protein